MKRFAKKLGYWTLYAFYLLAFLAAVDYFFFYRPWVGKLRSSWAGARNLGPNPDVAELEEIRHVDRQTMMRLGKARNEKESSFTRFPKAKDEGVVRICAFGDSFTEGDEVDAAHDYPTLLGKLFENHGAHNVEVVNFGVGGFGFHQAYMMWESVAPGFGCDVALLGPRGFQSLRDTTFGFIYGWTPYYLHARYVVRDGDAELVEVLGNTYGERFSHFYGFLPPWRYLRYNRTAPSFLKAFVPEDRELPNPFYYDRRPMDEEAHETYRILLGRMAESGVPILMGHHRDDIVELANGLGAESLSAVRFYERITFPYLELYTHAGPLGNDLLARQFFALLLGRGGEPLEVLEPHDVDWPKGTAPRRALSSYTRISIEIGGTPVGRFIMFGGESPTQADALVAFQGTGQSVLDGMFVPLDLELQPGMEVVLTAENGSRPVERRLGELAVIGGGVNLGRVDVAGLDFLSYKELQQRSERGEPTPLTHGEKRFRGLFFMGNEEISVEDLAGADSITILVGGQPALRGESGEMGETPGIWFRTVEGGPRYVRATVDTLPDLETLEESGVFEIVYEHWEDGTGRAPIAGWKKTRIEASELSKSSPSLLSIGPEGRVMLPIL